MATATMKPEPVRLRRRPIERGQTREADGRKKLLDCCVCLETVVVDVRTVRVKCGRCTIERRPWPDEG
jgi:hypothetical protein